MDKRVNIGLKAGLLSLPALIANYGVFVITGMLVVEFGQNTLRNTTDVVVSSLIAATPSMALCSLISVSEGNYVSGILFIPALACILTTSAALLIARFQLGIPIDINEILRNPIFHKIICPGCGRKVKGTWAFCPHCTAAIRTIVCPRCGHENPSSADLCLICEASLKEEIN